MLLEPVISVSGRCLMYELGLEYIAYRNLHWWSLWSVIFRWIVYDPVAREDSVQLSVMM
jgi:hypothetical protein